MPRRMIDSEIWRNEKVGNLPDAGRLLFIGIFSNADDDGRLKASPRFLKATVFPYDNDKAEEQIRELRDQCTNLGLIRVYSKNGQEFLDIPGWREHQQIRKDRYRESKHPAFEEADNYMPAIGQPPGNRLATYGDPNLVKNSPVKSNAPEGGRQKRLSPDKKLENQMCDGDRLPTVKSGYEHERGRDTPAKKQKGSPDPRVNEIFAEMKNYLGYPNTVSRDPIPSYGKEGQAIKRMLSRGFTSEEVMSCWKQKVNRRGGDFISMTWINEDIGKKGGDNGADKRGRRDHWPRRLPKKYTEPPGYDDQGI